ncbi:MAG: GAF domain-containing protein [Myxococcales bacterium]|nr:GAF domain-containing protein [Myxococcales bacterium]
MSMFDKALRIHVHDDGRALDGMFRLVELAKEQRPLEDTLSAMCRLISEMAGVEVVSVYLRERHVERDVLVMRGNVGFPADAVGRVQLGLDEGLTGVVAKRCRPVSVAVAQEDARYKHVDGIGDEKFAAYLGVPLLVRGEVAGVLVLQRRKPGMFTEGDVALASSVTAPLIFAIEKTAAARGGAVHRSFAGASVVRGRAVGRAVVLPPASPAPASEIAALHALEFDVVTAAQRLGHPQASVARALDNLALVAIALRDQVAAPSGDVLARLQRAPYRSSSQDRDLTALVDERCREVTDLWSFLVVDMQHRLPICGAVLVVPCLGTFLALEAVARGAIAVVVAGTAEPGARDVLEAAMLPAVAGVPELVARVRSGDVLEVDGTRGAVLGPR